MFNFLNHFLRLNKNYLKSRFYRIYKKNIFGGKESISGEGSNLEQTQAIRHELPKLLIEFNVNTFLDAPCGDFFWMKMIDFGKIKYIGVDIVDDLIDENNKMFGSKSISFISANFVDEELPQADLIFCRDCLVHLNFKDIKNTLLNFKQCGAKYLLTTTFINGAENIDLFGNDIWRTLNLQLAPFNFPPPLRLIDEKCSEHQGDFSDKNLGLWLLSDII